MNTRQYFGSGSSDFLPIKKGHIIGVDFSSPTTGSASGATVYAGSLSARTIKAQGGNDVSTEIVASVGFEGGFADRFSAVALFVPIDEKTCIRVTAAVDVSWSITVEE